MMKIYKKGLTVDGKKINPKTKTTFGTERIKRFIALCAQGGSIPEYCLQEMISRTTFDTWCNTYPEMMEAKILGKKIAEGWWVEQGRKHLIEEHHGPKLNTNLYKFIMGGRFGHTSDRDLTERMDQLEQRQSQLSDYKPQSAMAEIAECEDDNQAERPCEAETATETII
jgi:DNA-binding transcriptional regulator YhcF (GntR family)